MYVFLLFYFVVMPFVALYVTSDVKHRQRMAAIGGRSPRVQAKPGAVGAMVAIIWPLVLAVFAVVALFAVVSWALDKLSDTLFDR